nr:hypothetical protein [Tanacetum cinerariifolium]
MHYKMKRQLGYDYRGLTRVRYRPWLLHLIKQLSYLVSKAKSAGWDPRNFKNIRLLEHPCEGERKLRKGQNRIKTEQKWEACQIREKFKAVAVDKGRKTEENAKRMVENAYTKGQEDRDQILAPLPGRLIDVKLRYHLHNTLNIIIVLRNNMTQILTKGDAFKDDQYILATQVKQCFYLEDTARRQSYWKVVEHVNHKKFLDGGVIMVEEDPDVIHFDKSSDLPLSTSLSDLDNATMHIDGQSTKVDALPDIIDLDEDDDIINDEDLINVNDDDGVDVVYSSEEKD